jgi:hypothetical protein
MSIKKMDKSILIATVVLIIAFMTSCTDNKNLIIDLGKGSSVTLADSGDVFACDDPSYANIKKIVKWHMNFPDGSSKNLCVPEELHTGIEALDLETVISPSVIEAKALQNHDVNNRSSKITQCDIRCEIEPCCYSLPFEKDTSAPWPNATLHAIGVYEGPTHFGGNPVKDPSSSTINVHVHAIDTPIVLALSNYESVLWNIIADDGVEIKEIILSCYNASKISGINEKIIKVTRHDYGHPHKSNTAKRVAPILMAFTGLKLKSFQTAYEGRAFSVGQSRRAD